MKARKFPKMPKESASLSVWDNFDKKCREVIAYNNKLKAEEAKKKQKKEAEKKKKKAIISRVKKLMSK